MSSKYRNIARVLKAHGSKGEVTVAPLRGLPLLVEPGMEVALTPPALNRDRFVTVDAVSDDGDTARVLFSCSSSIDDAEALQGCFILAHEEDIELDELTAAYEDLIDREVIDRRRGSLGRIVEVMETPANDVLQENSPASLNRCRNRKNTLSCISYLILKKMEANTCQ